MSSLDTSSFGELLWTFEDKELPGGAGRNAYSLRSSSIPGGESSEVSDDMFLGCLENFWGSNLWREQHKF